MTDLMSEGFRRVIVGTAPEREQEFLSIWNKYACTVQELSDRKDFLLRAGPSLGVILVNPRTLTRFWMWAFFCQKAFEAFSPLLFWSQITGLPIKRQLLDREPIKHLLNDLKSISCSIHSLAEIEQFDEYFLWPDQVPLQQGKPKDYSGMMAFDLACMGLAYCILHELHHIVLFQSGSELNEHEEEMECDAFARQFILSGIDKYSQMSGYDERAVHAKRTMAIAAGTVMLLAITPKDIWMGSESHPSVFARLRALIESITIHMDNYMWIYFSSILLTQFNRLEAPLMDRVVLSQKSICLSLIDRLENQTET